MHDLDQDSNQALDQDCSISPLNFFPALFASD